MNLLRPIASLFGYDIIRKGKDVLIERHLRNLLRLHEINVVIDVGANQGQYALSLRKNGFSGTIHSFEPLESAYKKLSAHALNDPDWYTHHYALGSEETEMLLNVTRYSDFSSFLQPTDYCSDTFTYKSEVERQETVSIKTLDQIFAELAMPPSPRVLLKMDTQGYDLQVFEGARQTLSAVQAIQSEISVRKLYDGMPDWLTALTAYNDAGFSVSGLFPVTRDKSDLSVIEFDCVMVRTT